MGQIGTDQLGSEKLGGGAKSTSAVADVSTKLRGGGELTATGDVFDNFEDVSWSAYAKGTAAFTPIKRISTLSVNKTTSVNTDLVGFPFKIKERLVMKVDDVTNVKNVTLSTISDEYNVDTIISGITRLPEKDRIVLTATFTVNDPGGTTSSGSMTSYVEVDFTDGVDGGGGTATVVSSATQSFTTSSGQTYTDPDNDGTFTTDDGDTVSQVQTDTTGSESLSTDTDVATYDDPENASSPDTTINRQNTGGTRTSASGTIDTIEPTITDPYPITFTQRVCTTFKSLTGYNDVEVRTTSKTNPISHDVISVTKNPPDQPDGTICTLVEISLLEPSGVQEIPALFTLIVDYDFGTSAVNIGGLSVGQGVTFGLVNGTATGGVTAQFGIAVGGIIRGRGIW